MTRDASFAALFAIGLFAAMAACTNPGPPPPLPVVRQVDPSPPAMPQNAGEAADGLTGFTAELYGQLRSHSGNLIVSPYSIGTALALTAVGARGETLVQIQKVFHFPDVAKIGPAYGDLAAKVTAPPENPKKQRPELTTANSLWVQEGHPFRSDYLDLAAHQFRAGIYNVDFKDKPEPTRLRINAWVKKETHDHIENLVPAEAIKKDTRMVLANAIYFKAHWREPFEKGNTHPEDFTLVTGKKVKTPLMYQLANYSLVETDALQVLKLPYDGDTTSLYIILPRAANGLPAVEREASAENLKKWTRCYEPCDVKVWMPRFNFTEVTGLVPTLQKIGIVDAFDELRADFRGITDDPRGLYISDAFHKAYVEMDEVGTKAAAATAVVFDVPRSPPPSAFDPPPPKIFRADHPFLFVIKHEATGAILFIGRVEDPTR